MLTISLDALRIDRRVSLVKIDTEGHEAFVLAGMRKLLETHRPVLIVETDSREIVADLASMGYSSERLKESPNLLFKPNA